VAAPASAAPPLLPLPGALDSPGLASGEGGAGDEPLVPPVLPPPAPPAAAATAAAPRACAARGAAAAAATAAAASTSIEARRGSPRPGVPPPPLPLAPALKSRSWLLRARGPPGVDAESRDAQDAMAGGWASAGASSRAPRGGGDGSTESSSPECEGTQTLWGGGSGSGWVGSGRREGRAPADRVRRRREGGAVS
jgi:hypothetical protein